MVIYILDILMPYEHSVSLIIVVCDCVGILGSYEPGITLV